MYDLFLQICCGLATCSADPTPAVATSSAAVVLTRRTQETFGEIRTTLLQDGINTENWTAVEWLFDTARQRGWEDQALSVAELLQSNDAVDSTLRRQAHLIQILGRARAGQPEAAVSAFGEFLRKLRLRQPGEATELAPVLSLILQLQGDLDAARAVYDRVGETFFLNPEVRDFVSSRKERLDLVGHPAPDLRVNDLHEQPVTWAELRGRTVLVDFWATNCRPCLEEMPRLRRLHAELSTKPVTFIGVSLDRDVADISRFTAEQPIPWRVALDQQQATAALRVRLIPCMIAVDATGRVAAVDIPPNDLRETLNRLMERRTANHTP